MAAINCDSVVYWTIALSIAMGARPTAFGASEVAKKNNGEVIFYREDKEGPRIYIKKNGAVDIGHTYLIVDSEDKIGSFEFGDQLSFRKVHQAIVLYDRDGIPKEDIILDTDPGDYFPENFNQLYQYDMSKLWLDQLYKKHNEIIVPQVKSGAMLWTEALSQWAEIKAELKALEAGKPAKRHPEFAQNIIKLYKIVDSAIIPSKVGDHLGG